MLRVDRRIGSEELAAPLKRMGCKVELCTLDCADVAWTGYGPNNPPGVRVGVERKKLSEILACFGDSRFVSRQLPKLIETYDVAWLLIEGVYGVERDGRMKLGHVFGPRKAHSYEAFTGFLLTLQQKAGLRIARTASFTETVHWLHTAYRWWQKPWERHHSAYAFDTVRVPYDPTITKAPSVLRLVAAQLPGIGWERSAAVEKHFISVRQMSECGWREWARIDGIGEVTARRIVQALKGAGNGNEATNTGRTGTT